MTTQKTGGVGFLKGCLIAVSAIGALAVVCFGACAVLIGTTAQKVAETKRAEVQRMNAAPISDVTWEEIDGIYNVRSALTELQKKEHWKRYKGQKVKWVGTVSSMGETLGTLQLQVKLNPGTFTSDVLVRLKPTQRAKAMTVKKDDHVAFVGILVDWGTIMPITLDQGEIVDSWPPEVEIASSAAPEPPHEPQPTPPPTPTILESAAEEPTLPVPNASTAGNPSFARALETNADVVDLSDDKIGFTLGEHEYSIPLGKSISVLMNGKTTPVLLERIDIDKMEATLQCEGHEAVLRMNFGSSAASVKPTSSRPQVAAVPAAVPTKSLRESMAERAEDYAAGLRESEAKIQAEFERQSQARQERLEESLREGQQKSAEELKEKLKLQKQLVAGEIGEAIDEYGYRTIGFTLKNRSRRNCARVFFNIVWAKRLGGDIIHVEKGWAEGIRARGQQNITQEYIRFNSPVANYKISIEITDSVFP